MIPPPSPFHREILIVGVTEDEILLKPISCGKEKELLNKRTYVSKYHFDQLHLCVRSNPYGVMLKY
jgi:hypothetical protein